MPTVPEALESLLEAARTVPGVTALRGDEVGTMRTPAVVVGLPTVRWEVYCPDPTSARFKVSVVVSLDDHAMRRLLELLPLVHAAVETTGATVSEAVPAPFDSPLATAGLASYDLTTEFPL